MPRSTQRLPRDARRITAQAGPSVTGDQDAVASTTQSTGSDLVELLVRCFYVAVTAATCAAYLVVKAVLRGTPRAVEILTGATTAPADRADQTGADRSRPGHRPRAHHNDVASSLTPTRGPTSRAAPVRPRGVVMAT